MNRRGNRMTAADLSAASRRAQDLPERVTDPAALARVVALLQLPRTRGGPDADGEAFEEGGHHTALHAQGTRPVGHAGRAR